MYLPKEQIELAAADGKDVRYYLRGVYFDAPGKRFVCTNGHWLIVVPATCEKQDTVSGIIPMDAWQGMRKAERSVMGEMSASARELWLGIEFRLVKKNPPAVVCGKQEWPCIDAKYPDFDRVTPGANDRPIEVGLDGRYLADIIRAFNPAAHNGAPRPIRIALAATVKERTERAMLFKPASGKGYAVVMPYRT